jgi:hypothetical protein
MPDIWKRCVMTIILFCVLCFVGWLMGLCLVILFMRGAYSGEGEQ